MGKSPSQFEETIQHQFDRLCKLALKGEKIDYIRHMEYLRKNVIGIIPEGVGSVGYI